MEPLARGMTLVKWDHLLPERRKIAEDHQNEMQQRQ